MSKVILHVLLAEDDADDRLLFKEAFSELKLKTTVSIVNDGEQLMNALNKVDDTLPDILFLDLNLPRKNGLDCLKEIRSNKRMKDISVVIYSTSSSEQDMEATFHAGANVYITKPSDFKVLKEMLKKSLTVAHLYQEPPFNKAHFLLRLE